MIGLQHHTAVIGRIATKWVGVSGRRHTPLRGTHARLAPPRRAASGVAANTAMELDPSSEARTQLERDPEFKQHSGDGGALGGQDLQVMLRLFKTYVEPMIRNVDPAPIVSDLVSKNPAVTDEYPQEQLDWVDLVLAGELVCRTSGCWGGVRPQPACVHLLPWALEAPSSLLPHSIHSFIHSFTHTHAHEHTHARNRWGTARHRTRRLHLCPGACRGPVQVSTPPAVTRARRAWHPRFPETAHRPGES